MSRVRHWKDRQDRSRVTLFRSETSPVQRAVTVKFTPEEWGLLRRTVLAEYGLIPEYLVREQLQAAYDEVERSTKTIHDLEQELTYASGLGDDEEAGDE